MRGSVSKCEKLFGLLLVLKMYKFLVILFVLIASSGGNFNFWMNGDEVKRILGEILKWLFILNN